MLFVLLVEDKERYYGMVGNGYYFIRKTLK